MPGKLRSKVFFRADGNSQMGLGHVIRSLALIDIIKENFYVTFIICTPGEYLATEIRRACDELVELPLFESTASEAEYISTLLYPDDLIVLDGYAFDESYQRILKKENINIICIDDIYSTHYLADAIINHTSGIPVSKYYAAYYTRFYLGAEFALLRLPFLKCAVEDRDIKNIETVFVSFGGADPFNYTCQVVEGLISSERFIQIDVVIGAAFSNKIELLDIKKRDRDSKLRIHESIDVNQMLKIMQQSQIGICAASSVAFEYCCAGGGLFVIKTADNQEDCYRFLVNDELAREYSREAIQLISSEDIHQMIGAQKKIFNGQSIKNLMAVFNYYLVKDKIHYRRATEDDSKTYFIWANDPDVRKNSISKTKIEWDSHIAWFRNKMTNPHSKLFVFSYETKLIGQVRIDLVEGKWLISFSIDRESRGRGFAEIVVHKAIIALKEEMTNPFTIKAQVQESNIPSLKVFQHLGFSEGRSEELNGHLFRNFYKASQ